ncbi:hypothetical protein HD806DRAFT_441210 [Xylariaceae sp. AK1471]|nr:hypothetical protein HD806DRAFT_441210 [Xylariaceae sp. AK1471]
MDAWKDVVTSSQHAVYLGQWTNWSRGSVFGATITLTQRNGNLVIAFAAFFVTLVASRVWRVICLCCHQIYSQSESQDAPYQQRQVILRNSPSPQSALWKLVLLGWASIGSSTRKAGRTVAPISLALLSLGIFTGVTYILPLISTSAGDEVLLLPGECGILDVNAAYSNLTEFDELILPLRANQIANAANYAQQCYSNSSGTLGCTGFIKSRIPSVVQLNAKCPFQEEMCRSTRSNLFLDTGYINSHDHFGLNSPIDARVSFRTTLRCAPLVTEGYTSTKRSPVANYTLYQHGYYIGGSLSNKSHMNGLYEIEEVASQYRTAAALKDEYPLPGRNYQIDAFFSSVEDGSVSTTSDYVPSPKLQRNDGNSYIIFLVGNGVYFSEPSRDDWYRATTYNTEGGKSNSDSVDDLFAFDEAASPLGCVQQFQYCYEALPEGKQCGPLASAYDSASAALEMSPSQKSRSQLAWIYYQSLGATIYDVVGNLGARSLASQQSFLVGIQGPIAENQWQLDVVHWWASALALMQGSFIDRVVGPSDRRIDKYLAPPDDIAICSSQKIRSTAYMSFSVFGL